MIREVNYLELVADLQKALILKAVRKEPKSTSAEICEIIEFNGFANLSLDIISKQLQNLLDDDHILCNDLHYDITEKGKRKLEKLTQNLLLLQDLFSGFKSYTEALEGKKSIVLDKVYNNCEAIKTVPYTVKNLEESEDDFFLVTVPERGNYYDFTGQKGLGKGSFENHLICFVNNRVIQYIGVLEEYVQDRNTGLKRMYFKDGSIHKLSVPISENVIRTKVRKGFSFVRNKQNFVDPVEIKDFMNVIAKHW